MAASCWKRLRRFFLLRDVETTDIVQKELTIAEGFLALAFGRGADAIERKVGDCTEDVL